MIVRNDEMARIVGGAGGISTSTWWNAVARLINTLVDLGRTIGSSIYRIKNKNYCG